MSQNPNDPFPQSGPWKVPDHILRPPSGTFDGLNVRVNDEPLARHQRGEEPLPGGAAPEPIMDLPDKPIPGPDPRAIR